MLLCLLAALVYSIALVVQKPLVSRLSALHVTWLACTIGAVACLPFAGQLVDDTRDASASDIWWVVYLGLFPTAIAFTTYAFALQHMTASSLGITTYLVPPLTIVMGWLFLGETPPGDGVRRRRARPGRRRGGAPQATSTRGAAAAGERRRRHRPAMLRVVNVVAGVLVGLVAALHLYFLVLEMFLWTTPTGRRVFGLDADFAEQSKALAANQGLYNGFLVAGLVWGLVSGRTDVQRVLPGLRRRGGRVRRRHGQQADPGRPGRAGGARAGRRRAQLTRVRSRTTAGMPRRPDLGGAAALSPRLAGQPHVLELERTGRSVGPAEPVVDVPQAAATPPATARCRCAADDTATSAPRWSKARASTAVRIEVRQAPAAHVGRQPGERVDRPQHAGTRSPSSAWTPTTRPSTSTARSRHQESGDHVPRCFQISPTS